MFIEEFNHFLFELGMHILEIVGPISTIHVCPAVFANANTPC